MVISKTGRYVMRNGSIMIITELRWGIAVGYVEDSTQTYTYDAATGRTSIPGYDIRRPLNSTDIGVPH